MLSIFGARVVLLCGPWGKGPLELAPSAGLRNRLVYEDDRLHHPEVLKAVAAAEDLYQNR